MKTYSQSVKREVKDSVFTNLFKEPFYAKQLVQYLHPEYQTIQTSDLETMTIENVLANDIYNDLAIKCFDKVMIFIEQQSTYNPNIALRMMMYGAKTIENFIISNPQINLYSSKKAEIPSIEFFCICTYDRKGKYTDCEVYGDKEKYLYSRVKMIYPSIEEKNIVSQYVCFAQGVTMIRNAKLDNQEKMAKLSSYIGECIENGILAEYLAKHRGEVMEMTGILFDQEFVTQRMMNELEIEATAKGHSEGKKEGLAEGLSEGERKGKLEAYTSVIKNVLETQHLSFEEATKLFNIPNDFIEQVKKELSK